MTDPTIVVSIVTATGTIIVAAITYFQNKTLKKENKSLTDNQQQLETEIKEIKLISTGMVVAYFFSFIKPLFDKISESELTIIDGDKRYKIDGAHARLELLIPKQLDKTSFDAVNNFYRSISGVGEIVNNEERVLYKAINYRIDKGTDAAIIFIDVPSILKSALQYYKIPMFESKKNLQELLQREMNNFQSEIVRMIENDELGDKVSVRLYS